MTTFEYKGGIYTRLGGKMEEEALRTELLKQKKRQEPKKKAGRPKKNPLATACEAYQFHAHKADEAKVEIMRILRIK